MNNDDLNRLSNDLLPAFFDRADSDAKGLAKPLGQDPFKMLEDSLGVPFFTSLEANSKLRVRSLDDNRASKYLGCLGYRDLSAKQCKM